MIENGDYSTIREIAVAEKINKAYVGRVLRLTLLAPRIIEAILMGQPLDERQLHDLMQKMPIDWQAQSHPKF